MLELNYDIAAEKFQKQLAMFTEEQRKQLEVPIEEKYMRLLKRAKKQKFADGDVFVVSPQEGIYFYGRILKHIDDPKHLCNNSNVVFIFKTKTREKSMKDFVLDYSQILLGPFILNPVFWNWGMCETVGNYPITKADKKLDYGLFKRKFIGEGGIFVDADGVQIDHIPKWFEGFGLLTDYGLQSRMRKALLLDPSLLEFK